MGACSDGVNHIYSYSAGNTAGPRVLLVGGIHGEEVLGQHGAMRWFQQFSASADVRMVYLRSLLEMTWIPTLNPYGYRTARLNANAVDPNRNFDYAWGDYIPEDEYHAKGSAAFSEAESIAIKTLVDGDATIKAIIDCHNFGTTPSEMQVVMPTVNAGGTTAQAIGNAARARWASVYGSPSGYSISVQRLNEELPMMIHWFQSLGRANSAAVTVEAPMNFEESVGGVARHMTTDGALALYCGFITHWLLEWLGTW